MHDTWSLRFSISFFFVSGHCSFAFFYDTLCNSEYYLSEF